MFLTLTPSTFGIGGTEGRTRAQVQPVPHVFVAGGGVHKRDVHVWTCRASRDVGSAATALTRARAITTLAMALLKNMLWSNADGELEVWRVDEG